MKSDRTLGCVSIWLCSGSPLIDCFIWKHNGNKSIEKTFIITKNAYTELFRFSNKLVLYCLFSFCIHTYIIKDYFNLPETYIINIFTNKLTMWIIYNNHVLMSYIFGLWFALDKLCMLRPEIRLTLSIRWRSFLTANNLNVVVFGKQLLFSFY